MIYAVRTFKVKVVIQVVDDEDLQVNKFGVTDPCEKQSEVIELALDYRENIPFTSDAVRVAQRLCEALNALREI